MLLKNVLNESLVLKNWDVYAQLVAEAYKNAQVLNPSAVTHWQSLNESNHNFFKKVVSKINVNLVSSDKNNHQEIVLNGKKYKVNYMDSNRMVLPKK